MNKLIVESKNDKAFIEALIQHLHVNAEVDTPMCNIDDFECLGGSDETKLRIKIEELLDEVGKRGLNKIGVLFDMDTFTTNQRLDSVLKSLNIALENKGIPQIEIGFESVNQFINIPIDETTNVEIACFFTNLDGKGELETVLKAIKTQDSFYADCLEKWRECLVQKGKAISEKEFDKFWLSNYIRFDTCSKNDKKQSERKCSLQNFDYVMMNKSHIFDLDSPILSDLKNFLLLFN